MLGPCTMLACLAAICYLNFVFSAPALPMNLALPLSLQNASPVNSSTFGLESPVFGMRYVILQTPTHHRLIHFRPSNFRIPGSPLTLNVQLGYRLDLVAMRSLLIVANASIAENIEAHTAHAYSYLHPFVYDLGENVEIRLAAAIAPTLGLTWGELQTIIRGLWIYHIEGKRNRASYFDVYDFEHEYSYPLIGWGLFQKPMIATSEH